MEYEKLKPFADIESHNKANSIIRKRSVNKIDIRKFTFDGLDLHDVASLLDLGCGFGFMADAYAPMISRDALVDGIDVCEENREPFEKVIRDAGRKGEFLNLDISTELPFKSGMFDLVLASYSLYFFPGIIHEIPRVMKNEGIFVVITHSEHSFSGLYETVGLSISDSLHRELLKQFSAENGYEKLRPFFTDIMKKDYANSLIFHEEDAEELLSYATFKLPLLLSHIDMSKGLPEKYRKNVLENLKIKKTVIIDKNDSVFLCRCPVCP